jgi:hypothetical protein
MQNIILTASPVEEAGPPAPAAQSGSHTQQQLSTSMFQDGWEGTHKHQLSAAAKPE